MNPKTLTLIIASIFIIGIVIAGVGAERIISNLEGINLPESFIAGTEVQANFSFDYLNINENVPDSPLIIKIDINCSDEGENCPLNDCSVWKGDFELKNNFIKRWWIYPWIKRESIPLYCYENSPLTINHPQEGSTTLEVPNGTFYCYNINYKNLDLDEHDEVFLNILSDPALYPGQYNITASLYYLQEEYIHLVVTPIVSHVPYGQNTTVKFNMSFEIKGGNAIRMKMSDLFEGYYSSEGITFTIGGANYTVEELNARLVYNETNYSVGNEYNYTQDAIVFPTYNGIAKGSAVFMMDVKDYMKPGTYHGTYQFNVTKEEP